MRVVYTAAHLGHDIRTETVMGVAIPANEVAERAERIKDALVADGGFDLVPPTEHGEEPILAIHDEGLLRFLADAWPQLRREGIVCPAVVAEAFNVAALTEGMSPEVIEPPSVSGRTGFWSFDTSTPIVAGTYAAARAAVDVALTTADIVLGGETHAYGLCRPPGHHAARSMYGGSGVWPSRSNCWLILCWSCDTNRSVRRPSSPRARISASSSPAPKRIRSPTRILRPGQTNASQVWGSSWRVKKISTFPVRCSDRVARDGGCECTPAGGGA